jgi:DNA-binding transcriptional ArsR family regulator
MEGIVMYEEIFATSRAKVLRFLSEHVGRAFYEKEIVKGIDISHSAVNLATRSLWRAGLVLRERRGRMSFYAVDHRHPFVRQFKILTTIARLEPLLRVLRSVARQVILYGSCAEGADTVDSDVDLFIQAPDRSEVMAAIRRYHSGRPIQPVVVNTQGLIALKEREAAFYNQVQRGIVLWEAVDELAA